MKKTVLITGASSGLGFEFAKLFAKDNFNLIIVARNIEKLREMKKELSWVEVTAIQKDLSVPGSAKELYEEVKEKGLDIDVLINNAGIGTVGAFADSDVNKQMQMLQLNTAALTELTYYALQEMKQRKDGKILNVASLAGFLPGPLMAVYYATKAYVVSFSEALAEELKGTGISVTALCPGPVKTNFFRGAKAEKTKLFKLAVAAETVAKKGYKAMMKGRRILVPGPQNAIQAFSVRFMPRGLAVKIAKFMNK